jgi:hypothetical protein
MIDVEKAKKAREEVEKKIDDLLKMDYELFVNFAEKAKDNSFENAENKQ